jgi:hypothetical protein
MAAIIGIVVMLLVIVAALNATEISDYFKRRREGKTRDKWSGK